MDIIAVRVVFVVLRVPSLRSGGQKVGGGVRVGIVCIVLTTCYLRCFMRF